jgi:hypothetical protein
MTTDTVVTAGRYNPSRTRPKGYLDTFRPKPETERLIQAVLLVLNEYLAHWPLTVRQIFYRLIGLGQYEKTERFYDRLCEAVAKGRRARRIRFDAIRDDGVAVIQPDHYASMDAFLHDMRNRAVNYERDKLAGQDVYVEVLCEAAGMQPQLAEVAAEFSVPVYSSGGFDSLTAKWQQAQRIIRKRKRAVVLHLGDFDPSGKSIFDSLAADVEAFVHADRLDGFTTVTFERVALTAEQVVDYQLPTAPPKASDSRARTWDGETCQLEALAPDDLADILRQAITEHLDLARLKADWDEEEWERQQLTLALPAPNGGAR